MVKLNNYSKPAGKRGDADYYRWKAFVDEPEDVLDSIESVEYLLHPTFPEPRQLVTDRQSRFALESSGWGEFTIVAKVKFRDGGVEKVHYWLDLSKGWPQKEAASVSAG